MRLCMCVAKPKHNVIVYNYPVKRHGKYIIAIVVFVVVYRSSQQQQESRIWMVLRKLIVFSKDKDMVKWKRKMTMGELC